MLMIRPLFVIPLATLSTSPALAAPKFQDVAPIAAASVNVAAPNGEDEPGSPPIAETEAPILGERDNAAVWPVGIVVGGSPAQRVQIDLAKLREDDCILKLADRRIAGPRERNGACMLERERAGLALRGRSGCDFLGLTRRQAADLVSIERDHDIIGDGHFMPA